MAFKYDKNTSSYTLRLNSQCTDFSALEIQVNQDVIDTDFVTMTRDKSGWVISGLLLNTGKLNRVHLTSPSIVQEQVSTYVFENSKDLKVAVAAWQNDPEVSDKLYGPLASWSVGLVTDMSNLFSGATTFDQSLEHWDISQVQNMAYMFNGCHSFNQPLDRWDTGNVTDLTCTFLQCYAFNQPLETWDVGKVTIMRDTFNRASAFNQPLANWNVEQVVNMTGMFCGQGSYCQDLSTWYIPLIETRPVQFAGDPANGTQDNWPLTQQPSFTKPNLEPPVSVAITNETAIYENKVSNLLYAEIKRYAHQIRCSDFQGKGTIENYHELFQAAANIASESKRVQLNVEMDGFVSAGQAADDLSLLFAGLIKQLIDVNVIHDTVFLGVVASALKKIANLSDVFGLFRETVVTTNTLFLPATTHSTACLLQNVMSEMNSAVHCIEHFVTGEGGTPEASLSDTDQGAVAKAVVTINNWNTLREHGGTVAMAENPDIQLMQGINQQLRQTANSLVNLTQQLQAKLASCTKKLPPIANFDI